MNFALEPNDAAFERLDWIDDFPAEHQRIGFIHLVDEIGFQRTFSRSGDVLQTPGEVVDERYVADRL